MAELLEAGLTLTLIGMGTVFVLLGVLVAAVHAVAVCCRLLEGAASAGTADAPPDDGAADAEIAAVVSAAIEMFHRDQAQRSAG
jgi:Na+-transporting methylmalonyl-CoA/oxaloacetate decarboxylase gamma subunit